MTDKIDDNFECKQCDGTGKTDPTCDTCHGDGWVDDPSDGGTMECPDCDGNCTYCGGAGEVDTKKCEKCGVNEVAEYHTCPLQMEVHQCDIECTCCMECQNNCAGDV